MTTTFEERIGRIVVQPSGHTVVERQLVILQEGKQVTVQPLPDRVIEPGESVTDEDHRVSAVVKADREARRNPGPPRIPAAPKPAL